MSDNAVATRFDDDGLFDVAGILPDAPLGDDGQPLDVLHDREYRVRAYRKSADVLLVRGAVRDQKPPGLYFPGDPDPLTVHHMQVDLEVSFPSMEIVDARVEFLTHPGSTCPAIVEHYGELVGLSIARGFINRVRELFGGPRGCTHTTALLQAMAPVAIQSIWSMRSWDAQRDDLADPTTHPATHPATHPDAAVEPTLEQRRQAWQMNVNTCHVWADDGEQVRRLESGDGGMEAPLFAEPRMVALGIKPEDWHRRMPRLIIARRRRTTPKRWWRSAPDLADCAPTWWS